MANVGEAEVQVSHSGSGGTIGALNSVGGAITSIGRIAAGVALAGLTAFGGALSIATSEAMQNQAVMAQTNAVIASTKGVAGVSAGAVSDLATSLQNMTGIADDVIQGGENILLTFTKIGAETFPRATSAALDMSVALGADLKSTSIQVGKALQGNANAVTALQKSGVAFTESQKALITKLFETGRAAEAQSMILAELETEFGGSAAAAGKTFAGQMEIAKLKLLDIAEAAGMELLPALSLLATAGLPLIERFAMGGAELLTNFAGALTALAPTANRVATVIGGAFANLRAGMSPLELAGRLFPQAFSPEIRGMIENVAGSLERIGTALSPALAGFVTSLGDALSTSLGVNGSLIIDNITTAFSGLATFLETNGPAIAAAASFIGSVIGAAIGGIVTIISGVAGAIGQLLTGDFMGALGTLGAALTGFADGVVAAFGGVDFGSVLATWGGILSNAGTIISASVGNAVAAAQEWANSTVGALLAPLVTLAGNISGYIGGAIAALQGMVGGMASVGAALGNGLVNGAAGVVNKIIGVVVGAVTAAIAAAKAAAGVSSPSKETMFIGAMMGEGLAKGLSQTAAMASAAMAMTVNQTLAPAYAAPVMNTGSGGGPSAAGGGVNITLIANGVNDPIALVDMVEREIRVRGKSFTAVA